MRKQGKYKQNALSNVVTTVAIIQQDLFLSSAFLHRASLISGVCKVVRILFQSVSIYATMIGLGICRSLNLQKDD